MATTAYFGTRLSPHISRTPEGFVIAHDVPLCRTAERVPMLYRGSELGLRTDDTVRVFRAASEVLSKKHMASIEGKSVVDGHGGGFVNADNASWRGRGHVQNVRSGPQLPDGERSVIGDIVITDSTLAQQVLDGELREVSLGYDCEYVPNADGTFSQRRLRCNHCALVPQGRSGEHVRIYDRAHEPTFEEMARAFHRRNPTEVVAESSRAAADALPETLRRGDPQSWDELAEQHQRLLNGEENMAKKSSDEQSGLIAALKLLLAQLEGQGSELESDEEAELISSADSSPESIALAHLRSMRPAIERSGNRATIDAYNSAVRAVKSKMHARALVTDARSSSRSFLRSESFAERVSRVRAEESVGRSFEEAAANARAKMLGTPTPEAASRAADSSHADEDWASAHRRAGEEMRNAKR